MGLSNMPTPSEGVLTVLVVNTVMSIAILKQILNSFLQILGIRYVSDADLGSEQIPDPTLVELFRSQFKPVHFGRKRLDKQAVDCRVCLSRFESDSVVNRLPCGHVFHKNCVEKWLNYHHATCPLCRTQILTIDEGVNSWSW